MSTPSNEPMPVRKLDVVPYAKKACRTCYGTGLYTHISVGGVRTERLCGCALKRFLKTDRAAVNPINGQLMFKPLTLNTLAEAAKEPTP